MDDGLPPPADDIAAEVERRLRQRGQEPSEVIRRFDRNGDGVLDDEEWRAARAVLRREVDTNFETETIGDYRVVAPIGRGTQGHTRLAVHEPTGDFVALKEVDFAGLASWNVVDTFEREATVLGGLNHPAIPRIRETFRIEEDGELRLLMAQEFVEGNNLEMLLDDGALFDEARLIRYADQLLDVLAYLHVHTPPVVHRDIKPANIIERPDGKLALVDFGAAQGTGADEQIIGTTGYMPPEQLMGRAVPASDMYGLGATLVHLATRKHPSDLGHGIDLDWRKYSKVSDEFARWLDRCVAPMAEDRYDTARIAKIALGRMLDQGEVLETREALVDYATNANSPTRWQPVPGAPSGSLIVARTMPGKLLVDFSRVQHSNLKINAWISLAFVFLGFFMPVPMYVRALIFGTAIVILLFGMFRTSIDGLSGDERGLTLTGRTTQLLPLRSIEGPNLVSGQNGWAVYINMRTESPIFLARLNDADGRYLRDTIQRFLVELRMEDE